MLSTMLLMNDCVSLAKGSEVRLFGKWLHLKAPHFVRRLGNRTGSRVETKRAKAGRQRVKRKTCKRSSAGRAGGVMRAGLLRPSSISDILAEETKTVSKCKALAGLAGC